MAIVVIKAELKHIPGVQNIARLCADGVGFVRRVALVRAVQLGELYVAMMASRGNEAVVGFANTHKRKDGWTTIYEIAVHPSWQRRGVGRELIDVLPRPVRLKCTVDNEGANAFYDWMGFQLVRVEDGRKRKLNVWERVPYAPVDEWECPICGGNDLERDYDDCVNESNWAGYIIQKGFCGCTDCGALWREDTIYTGRLQSATIEHRADDGGYDYQVLQNDDDYVCRGCGGRLVMGGFDESQHISPSADVPTVLRGECWCGDCGRVYRWEWGWDTPFCEIYWDKHVTAG
jgi:GNAT superfamily N-acetyltransferase